MKSLAKSIRSCIRPHNWNVSILTVGVIVISSLFLGDSAAATSPSENSSQINLANYLSDENRPVFYLRVFGHDFPVPVRFEYSADTHPPGVDAQFQSPGGALAGEQENYSMSLPLEWIDVGSFRDYMKNSRERIRKHPAVEEHFHCYGLLIDVYRYTSGILAKVQLKTVMMHDNAQYVAFEGVNLSTPKELLRLYGVINRLNIGAGCSWIAK